MSKKNIAEVAKYYNNLETFIGYKIVNKRSQHHGLHLDPKETYLQSLKNLHNDLMHELNYRPGMRILDLGCGQGFVGEDLVKRYDISYTGVTIVDREYRECIRMRGKLSKSLRERINFKILDYHSISNLYKDQFDGIFSIETLCHAYDLRTVLKGCYSSLKKEGRGVFYEYKLVEKDRMTNSEYQQLQEFIELTSTVAIPNFMGNKFIELLKSSGFAKVKEYDLREKIEPSINRFYQKAIIAKKFTDLFGLTKKMTNLRMAIYNHDMFKQKKITGCRYTVVK